MMKRRQRAAYGSRDMRYAGFGFVAFLMWSLFAGSCTQETKIDVADKISPKNMPSMVTHNVNTLISDSGVTQYKIVAPVWYVYDEVDTPYWVFPEGLYLQKFDRKFNVEATVAADTATFYRMQKLWKLEGNVEMTKAPKDLFLSPRVFWDQRRQKLYSDTFIHIENATHVLEGTGFESNERLTKYRILHPTGIFPVDRNNLKSDR
ncbi:MAG: LPS export ABC transporter periplasmic protein LptC [Bacteroides sp.]|nr:LPS export ABC transporter periplasmic protein LptC [Bacteroides sp.]